MKRFEKIAKRYALANSYFKNRRLIWPDTLCEIHDYLQLVGSNATQIICGSFVLVIALGTLLLTLPIASRNGRLGVVDAMFTATSATCVTGLVVRDTWTQFTMFGQVVILLLIQVGGLGLVTLTSFFALAAKRRMGFRDLRLLGESVSASGYSQATEVLKIVIRLAFLFEAIGIVLLACAFVPQFGLEGVWISIFTRIGASDDLAGGQSTFMVEMTEVSEILHQARWSVRKPATRLWLPSPGHATRRKLPLGFPPAALPPARTRLPLNLFRMPLCPTPSGFIPARTLWAQSWAVR